MDGDSKAGVNLLWVGLLVEGGLLFAAVVLGRLGLYDHLQPLNLMDASDWKSGAFWGVIATVPLLIYLIIFHYWTPGFLKPMRQIVDTKMKPMFADSTTIELLVLALMAGFGEELFFRWCLQGGVTSLIAPLAGDVAAIAIGIAIASLIFGVCHWVNAAYGMTTLIVGVYLGATMVWSTNWLVPAIAHALFDFIALIYIVRAPARFST
jgi:membrane protease YdiL (CAAX protease family)